jgi:organic hydroperoxide reductase OsmC/OhrA
MSAFLGSGSSHKEKSKMMTFGTAVWEGARISGADRAKFEELTARAKAGCPVSKLVNTEITLDATLAS